MKKEYRKYGNIGRNKVDALAREIRNKEKQGNGLRPDKTIFDKGLAWYDSGLPFEDAPEELRNDGNFINGFKKGERLAFIASLQEEDSKKRR